MFISAQTSIIWLILTTKPQTAFLPSSEWELTRDHWTMSITLELSVCLSVSVCLSLFSPSLLVHPSLTVSLLFTHCFCCPALFFSLSVPPHISSFPLPLSPSFLFLSLSYISSSLPLSPHLPSLPFTPPLSPPSPLSLCLPLLLPPLLSLPLSFSVPLSPSCLNHVSLWLFNSMEPPEVSLTH